MEEKKSVDTAIIKERPAALLPMVVFLVLYIGGGIAYGDFYKMPVITVFLIALAVAFFQSRKKGFDKCIEITARGIGDTNIVTMVLVFLTAGAFTGIITAAGGVDSTVNLGLTLLPGSFAVVGVFVIGCFISISMGSSVATIVALAPIAIGIADKTGFSMALCVGAVVSGAMFGDNLSMISDTTIAATKTQGCSMADKFRMNFKIVIIPAILTLVLLFVLTWGATSNTTGTLDYNFWLVLPYLVVLIGAVAGVNVFVVLILGIVLSAIIGLGAGTLPLSDLFLSLGTGVSAMYDITVISIIVGGMSALMKEAGGIQAVLGFVKRRVYTQRGAELGIGLIAAGVDVATANNTVAIVISGDLAADIAKEYDVKPEVSASILDIFTSTVQGLLPYGAQLLYASAATAGSAMALTPFQIMPYVFYSMLMGVAVLIYIGIFSIKRSRKIQTA